ncbi:major facilitator superfamily domain-containing protein [Gloeopeniophorella convolvens]|nr:major facilitator superfamily domain-containing protein [Gloeopeniophorella convolvens]
MASEIPVEHASNTVTIDSQDPSPRVSRISRSSDLEKVAIESEKAVEQPDIIYVVYDDGDKRDPMNFSWQRKWTMTFVACLFTGISAAAASSYNTGFPSMTRDLNCTNFQATIGLSVYPLGFGLVPLFTAPFSEEVGRRPLYLVSGLGFMMMHVMVAELLGGAFGSTGATMVGGSIADIWQPKERGLPMSLFSLAAIGATGLGPVVGAWIEANHRFEWRWIQWFHVIATGFVLASLILFMRESRTTVILNRLAKKKRKETGDERYKSHAEVETPSLRALLAISCTRPLCELSPSPPLVLWIGFVWGVLYCMIESVAPIFQTLHHFGTGETGTIFLTMTARNIVDGQFCRRDVKRRGPEARLHWACISSIMSPIAMFLYAWTSFPQIPWIAMAIGITIFVWASFILYLAAFTYLADCYGTYASSAIAAQSLSRNLMGMAFPLFTKQMFAALTYKWGNTLFGCVVVLMTPIPWILFRYGPTIRAHSKISQRTMEH